METLSRSFPHYPFHDIQLVQYGQENCDPGHHYGPYVRDFYLIHFVTEGLGRFHIRGREYRLTEGELFLIPPDVLTFYQADVLSPWHYTWIGFRGTLLPGFIKAAGLTQDAPTLRYSHDLWEALNSVIQQAESSGFDSLTTVGHICFFLEELIKCNKKREPYNAGPHRYIQGAVTYIDQHIYERISVSQLAQMAGIDRSYFCSIFKQYQGVSPQQYILNLKISKAKTFLETTDVDVRYIADSLGYGDLFTFSHAFKQKTGISPREWRKRYGNADNVP